MDLADKEALLCTFADATFDLQAAIAEGNHANVDNACATLTPTYKGIKELRKLHPLPEFTQIHLSYIVDITAARAMFPAQVTSATPAGTSFSDVPRLQLRPYSGEDPCEYRVFSTAFDELVHKQNLPVASKMARLLSYTIGKAHEAIKGCSYSAAGYEKARQVLRSRFGDPYVITHHVVSNLRDGKPAKSPKEIQQLADDLAGSINTLQEAGTMSEVESQTFVSSIIKRLPPRIQYSWRRNAVSVKRQTSRYPSFEQFAEFIQEEAEAETDPLFGKSADRQHTSHTASIELSTPPSSAAPLPIVCPCSPPTHRRLIYCPVFKSSTVKDRIAFVDSKSLTYLFF